MRLHSFPAYPLPDTLLSWQREAIPAVRAHMLEGAKRILGVAATGMGKTVFAANMIRALDARTLMVAHREELIDQMAATVAKWHPDASVGKVMSKWHEPDAQVVVATVQTLLNRLDQVPGPFDLIIVDETHHIMANTYQAILHHYCGTADLLPGMPVPDSAPVVLGITATPDRADRKKVADFFDHRIAFSFDTRWAIDNNFLCDLRTTTVTLDGLDLNGVKIQNGDWASGDLGKALQSAGAPKFVVQSWVEHGENRKTMVFSPTVEMSMKVAEEFVAAGIVAEHMDGKARGDDRRDVLDRFRNGSTQVLCNVALYTEGFDVPEVACIVVARPTKSRALLSQIIGRGLRVAPNKDDCIVIDLAGATSSSKLVQAHDLLGLHRALERHESAKQVIEREAQEAEDAEQRATQRRLDEIAEDWDHGTARFVNVDAFGRPIGCKYKWDHDPRPGCQDRYTHVVDETWRVVFRRGDTPNRTWIAGAYHRFDKEVAPIKIHESQLIDEAMSAAELWISGNRTPGAQRKDAPSQKQLNALRRYGWDGDFRTLTAGKAGAIIGNYKAKERLIQTAIFDKTDADKITMPRVIDAMGNRRMLRAEDIPSMLGLLGNPGPMVLDRARSTLAAMHSRGLVRPQGEAYVVVTKETADQ